MKFYSVKSLIFILPFCITFLACAKQVKDKTTQTNMNKSKQEPTIPTTPSTTTVKQTKSVEPKVDKNLFVSLQRTPCFGQCPVFKIQLFDDGKVVYEGKAYCKRMGTHKATASPELIKAIQQKASDIKYLSFNEKYPKGESMITDIPTTISYIKVGSESKMVYNNYDAPTELVEFERWLEQQFESLKWEVKE
jgi:Domain of unknown function (DUF6438)